MPTYTRDQGGPAILSDLKARLAKANANIESVAGRDDLPHDYRRRIRNETIGESQRLVADARQAFQAWAQSEAADARRRYRDDPVGSAADETRRLRREMETNRLIESSRLADERRGPVIVGGRPVANGSAYELAAKAQQAYLNGEYDKAQTLATASTTLGGPASAQDTYDAAQGQLDLANPARASALRDLANVDVAIRTFERDSNAAIAEALQGAAAAAIAIGDDGRQFTKAALGPSMAAKMAAYADSLATGAQYQPPAGTMLSEPLGDHRPTDGEIHRKVERVS